MWTLTVNVGRPKETRQQASTMNLEHALRCIIFTGLAVLLSLAGTSVVVADTAVRFLLDRPVDGAAAPLVVAKDRRLFGGRGLDVQMSVAKGSQDAIDRVAKGDGDIALADLNVLIRYRDTANAAPVKAVFVLFNRASYAVVARKSRGIASLTDLPGKTLGVAEGDLAIRLWPALAHGNGIDATKVKTEKIGAAVREPMLSAGQVDAVSGLSFGSAVNLRDRGVPASDLVVFKFADYGSPVYGTAIVVNPAFAATSPEAVRAFLVSVIEGVKLSAKEPALAIDAVLARLDSGVRDNELERLHIVLHDSILTDEVRRNGLGAIAEERFEASLDAIAMDAKFRRRPALTDIFDDAFLPPAEARKAP